MPLTNSLGVETGQHQASGSLFAYQIAGLGRRESAAYDLLHCWVRGSA
jgi:hypothetical protein